MPEVGLEEVESRLQNVESRLQKVGSRLKGSFGWLKVSFGFEQIMYKLWKILGPNLSLMEQDLSSLEQDLSTLEKKILLEESQLLIIRAMPICGVSVGSGSMKWPKLLLNKGPSKTSEPASDVETLPWTPDEIRDHNEKLLNRLAPLFTEHVKSALLPVLRPVAAALEEERKHQDTVLQLEERQLALNMRLNRCGVGRSQRRRRASSAMRLRPRTRQLGPRLRFPWKR